MCAAVRATQCFAHAIGKTGTNRHANQFSIVGRDLITLPDVGHRVGGGFGINNGQRGIDGDAKPHRMNCFAGTALAARQLEIDIFRIMEVAFDIEQAVVAFVTTYGDVAAMQGLAGYGRR